MDGSTGLLPADWIGWIQAALSVVGAASAVAAVTPTPKDDKVIGKVYSVLQLLALHIGYAAKPGDKAR